MIIISFRSMNFRSLHIQGFSQPCSWLLRFKSKTFEGFPPSPTKPHKIPIIPCSVGFPKHFLIPIIPIAKNSSPNYTSLFPTRRFQNGSPTPSSTDMPCVPCHQSDHTGIDGHWWACHQRHNVGPMTVLGHDIPRHTREKARSNAQDYHRIAYHGQS